MWNAVTLRLQYFPFGDIFKRILYKIIYFLISYFSNFLFNIVQHYLCAYIHLIFYQHQNCKLCFCYICSNDRHVLLGVQMCRFECTNCRMKDTKEWKAYEQWWLVFACTSIKRLPYKCYNVFNLIMFCVENNHIGWISYVYKSI